MTIIQQPASGDILRHSVPSTHVSRPSSGRSLDLVSQSLSNRYLADPDVQLMLKISADDQSAFEQLVLKYQDRLVGFFFHIVRDRSVSEDLAQEAFLRVYKARERYEPTARFSTWLFRIAHNLASNQIRGAVRRKEVSLQTRNSTDSNSSLDTFLAEQSALMPARTLDSREMQQLVRDAVAQLSERQRTAVILHRFEDMSYEEIGDVMGLGTVAVKSLLSRARIKLKESLERFL